MATQSILPDAAGAAIGAFPLNFGRVMTRIFVLMLAGALLLPALARADDDDAAPKSFWEQDTLLGDLGGFRPWLAAHGMKLSVQNTDEGWGNFSGGLRHGWTYTGQTQATLTLDTGKAFGWEGGTVGDCRDGERGVHDGMLFSRPASSATGRSARSPR